MFILNRDKDEGEMTSESHIRVEAPRVLPRTSNVRGEPIVCTPADAYGCFMRRELDALVLEHAILMKHEQPEFADAEDWRKTYELD